VDVQVDAEQEQRPEHHRQDFEAVLARSDLETRGGAQVALMDA
jgi:hypothetical protein